MRLRATEWMKGCIGEAQNERPEATGLSSRVPRSGQPLSGGQVAGAGVGVSVTSKVAEGVSEGVGVSVSAVSVASTSG